MNIAVFGWYHHRNAGDDRIQYCITRWLDGHTLAFLPAGRPPSLAMLRTYDAVVIGGGGILTSQGGVFRNMARWTRAIGIPVALVGVSAEHLPDGLRAELREFLDLCCFAWFRDQGSIDALGPHPRAFAGPDLTWLYPFTLLEPPATKGTALCLRWHTGFDLEAWGRAVRLLDGPVVGWPLYFENGGDTEPLRRILPSGIVPDEFSIDPLKHVRCVITMRYHGAVFALQAGRPVLTVRDQPKVTRFMTESGLAAWHVPQSDIGRLPDLVAQFDAAPASARERVLELRRRMVESASTTGDSARDRLLSAAETAARARPRWKRKLRTFLDTVPSL